MRWTLAVVVAVALPLAPLVAQEAKPATIAVKLPADAVLLIGDYKSTQTGAARTLETPALEPGKEFTYTLKATWSEGGKEVARVRMVTVKAGGTFDVDFTKEEAPPPSDFALQALPDVTLAPGAKKSISVEVKRDKLQGPIRLTLNGLPAKVTAKGDEVAADADKGTLDLTAAADAAAGTTEVTLTATAGKVVRQAKFKLRVEKPAALVKLGPIPALAVEAGGEATLTFPLKTANLDRPVRVTFSNLPQGVSIEPVTVPADGTAVKVGVKAGRDARPGESKVRASAASDPATDGGDFLLTVKARAEEPAGLTLTPPDAVTAAAGTSKAVSFKIARTNLDGPVTIVFADLPDGVALKEVVIPAGRSEENVTIEVGQGASPGTSKIKARASGGTARAEALFALTVSAAPAPPKKAALRIEMPDKVEVEAGKSCQVKIKITRDNLDGAVTLTFGGPKAVADSPALTVPAGQNDAVWTLPALREKTAVLVTASAGDVKTTARLEVAVKAAPAGALKLALPPTLTLTNGGPAKLLPVRLTRTDYDGPVAVTFSGVPDGVKLGEVTVGAGKTVAYVEAVAADATEGETEVTVKATGGTASTTFTLKLVVKK